ncbi:putative regulatory protein RecX [Peptoniphilus duerdenii ATCC BAA-1640]|uniref:Regulatory protein RecX n=1 Tax=Peptoniphilus duerdenii ATCC BAA-1640 TaxID=862517 RepID=E0NMU7_9FIRM|nr:RecX family transcriptional regulator [Peptoniphilus duerdenii]EFM24915.1 putative regulatory protein RecX [Peptoniphilus duerdenii ATCC BAA-1640]
MNILKISFDKNTKKYIVETDKDTFYVYESTFVKFNLYVGKEINEEICEKFSYYDKFHEAKTISFKFLKNLKTEFELRMKLKNSYIDDEIIDETIKYIYSLDLLDDKDYAYSYAQDKSKFNRWGKNKIKYKLKEKGVPDKYIDSALETISDDNELKNIRKDKEAKERSLKPDAKNRKAKIMNFLYRRGYSISLINKVIDE